MISILRFLVAHNIDLAERVELLRKGNLVEFSGEFEWNPQGGVIHWTHRDPQGRHADGWIKHNGKSTSDNRPLQAYRRDRTLLQRILHASSHRRRMLVV